MFRKFKYVIVANIYPRIGSVGEQHRDLAGGDKVTSAGWGRIEQNAAGEFSVVTFGESIGLGVRPNPQDASTLARLFFGKDL